MSKPLIISNKIGYIIDNIDDWKDAFVEIDNEKHWKKGRSAWALAKYFTTPNIQESKGITMLHEMLRSISAHNFTLSYGEIEHESKFDAFKGKGRMQDLVIWGEANDVRIAICIEAKVDEAFGHDLAESYQKAEKVLKTKQNSKATQRIENLCSKYFPNEDIRSLTSIKYQLLHYLEGTIKEAKKIGGIAFMPVLVFHTDKYNGKTGETNKKYYETFLKALHFQSIQEGKAIYKIEREGVTVYTSYIEIKL